MKECSKCKRVKPLCFFPRHAGRNDGFDSQCKSCKHDRYIANAEKERINSRERYARNIVALRIQQRAWWTANKEVSREASRNWRKNNPDAQKIASGRWTKEHPEKRAAAQSKRRTSQENRTPDWLTPEDFIKIEFYYSLSEALRIATGIRHSVDHIVPLQGRSVSGLHVPWNLQVIPLSENSKKGNHHEI